MTNVDAYAYKMFSLRLQYYNLEQDEIRKLTGSSSYWICISAGIRNKNLFWAVLLSPPEKKFGENSSNFFGCAFDIIQDRAVSCMLVLVCVTMLQVQVLSSLV